jgi:hypothetical protein
MIINADVDGDPRQPIAPSLDLSRVQARTDLEADLLDRLHDRDGAAKGNPCCATSLNCITCSVDDVCPPILTIALFILAERNRLFRSKAHGLYFAAVCA